MPLTVLAHADLVLPDAVLAAGLLVLEDDRIAAVEPAGARVPAGAATIDCAECLIVPGFVDVHVHGVLGVDVLDGPHAVVQVAERLPRYGVTSFCPTSVACSSSDLDMLLRAVRETSGRSGAARVRGAHLESNFINPDYRGAQPRECLRRPPAPLAAGTSESIGIDSFTGDAVWRTMGEYADVVAIVTLAPEIDGGLDLVRDLVGRGQRVSIGHSGASYEVACQAIDAGVRHATHLFNRMSPLAHRAPGVPGAVLDRPEVAAEIICDGHHVHPALVRFAIAAKGVDRIMAITDGTAGAGLRPGARARLGGRPIIVTERAAELEDGTLAGNILTMDGAFRMLVQQVGLDVVAAARACATTPAKELDLLDAGAVRVGALADLVVLGRDLRVRQTFVGGRAVFGG
ncbi:MAG: N-acetylglucosamine-6-phosphate deacetylase [Vicinamibacterales bacterium]